MTMSASLPSSWPTTLQFFTGHWYSSNTSVPGLTNTLLLYRYLLLIFQRYWNDRHYVVQSIDEINLLWHFRQSKKKWLYLTLSTYVSIYWLLLTLVVWTWAAARSYLLSLPLAVMLPPSARSSGLSDSVRVSLCHLTRTWTMAEERSLASLHCWQYGAWGKGHHQLEFLSNPWNI